jgi:hypothetical protein
VFTCHEHVWRMFADVKADTRRIPDRYNQNEEIVETEALPEPEPEPVFALPAPEPEFEPEPEPEAVAVVEEPVPIPIEETIEEFVTEYDVEPEPVAPLLDEVEYSWHDMAANGNMNGKSNGAAKPSKNGRHKSAAAAPSLRPWPAEPMIHRPDWW